MATGAGTGETGLSPCSSSLSPGPSLTSRGYGKDNWSCRVSAPIYLGPVFWVESGAQTHFKGSVYIASGSRARLGGSICWGVGGGGLKGGSKLGALVHCF